MKKVRIAMSMSIIVPYLLFGVYFLTIGELLTSAILLLVCAAHIYHISNIKKGRI